MPISARGFRTRLRCPDSTQVQTYTTHTLRQLLQTQKVSPLMITVLIHQLTHWYQRNPQPFPFDQHPQDTYILLLQQAVNEQSQIGWSNFLRGRLTNTWYTAHDHDHKARYLSQRYSTTNIAPLLVTQLWDNCRSFWQHRNNKIHGTTHQEAQITQQALLHQKIRDAYNTQDQFNPHDHTILFTLPLETRLNKPLQAQLQWYALYQHCLNAPPEPTDTPPPLTSTLHNFFRRFIPRYYPTSTVPTTQPPNTPLVNSYNQQPANTTP